MGLFDFLKPKPKVKDETFLEMCRKGTPEEIEDAIIHGASVHARYPMWDFYRQGSPSTEQFATQLFTPLLMAAKYNHNEGVLEVLLKHGADVNARDFKNWTPLLYASWWTVCFGIHPKQIRELSPEENPLPKIRKRVKILLNAGADVNAKDDSGKTALMYAANAFNGGDVELVNILLAAGADVNAKNDWGYTALMYAANYNVEDGIFEPLIKAGADVNARDNEGRTALIIASDGWCKEGIETMLRLGADVNARDNKGKTAAMYVSERNHWYKEYLLSLLDKYSRMPSQIH